MRVHALELAVALAIETGRAMRPALVALVALVLLLAGYRPTAPTAMAAPAASEARAAAPAAPAAMAAPMARDWAGRPLERLSVRELRMLAREAGHRALARSGRRADLLAALGAA